ncbi:VWA domain-containing protein [Rhodospirillaceae bacterium KN72]|uniref:VWA domain-containing protein n=1 Tax=Pacificispira spongiicola TaxID=2729598 RepID=A0A7Y0DYS2_9PROT|nr:VWA domain-containing protein [Pacificispira spongiicola]NMM44053.1 VWA domain-containing protein [Pacificispira spongiicola]
MTDKTATPAPDLAPNLVLGEVDGGRLAENIMHFARVLRAAGLPVGPGKVLQALEAVSAVGVADRQDFYWTLHAVFVNRRDQRELFDQAFHFFWRNPNLLEKAMAMMLPAMKGEQPPERPEMATRLQEALAKERPPEEAGSDGEDEEESFDIDASLTWSKSEVLAEKDFEKMTTAELEEARRAIRRLRLAFHPVPSRRFYADPKGHRTDLRATLRRAARSGGDIAKLSMRKRRRRVPPLVVLCDISGSMDRYARMMLHFIHALTNDRDRVHSFLFGTRLTNVTRTMRRKDPDVAVDQCATLVADWAGGTRIGHTLAEFNRDWSRRVLSQGPIVLLISDGLDRDGAAGLEAEMDRLHKSCRSLIWLNPLLRWDGYEPKASGARAMIRHVDSFRPIHNLDSLTKLADALTHGAQRQNLREWKELAA